LDQLSNSRCDKEDENDSSQTAGGVSDFLTVDSGRTILRKKWGQKEEGNTSSVLVK
jgi:hypothetical protein